MHFAKDSFDFGAFLAIIIFLSACALFGIGYRALI